MIAVLVTVRATGRPARRIVGIYPSTVDAIISVLQDYPKGLGAGRISARVIT